VNSGASFPPKIGRVTLGIVGLTSGEKHHFTPEPLQLLTAVTSELGVLVENARLHTEIERRLGELHAAHEQLQYLSQRLLGVQEMERRHIARELHDEIGQLLTALQLLLDIAGQSPADAMATSQHKAQTLVHELMDRVRNLSLDLRPPMLDDLGLLPALLWHFKRYTTQSHVAVDFRHTGLGGRRFRTDLETAAYRVVQEALTNVARHAQVKHAAMRIWTTHNTLGVQIEDQGIGFDPQTSSVDRLGLVGMRERVRLLSGTLTIEAAPGAGTRITAEWPLTDQDGRGRDEPDHRPGGRS
jgi:signal transduction histidine kinase